MIVPTTRRAALAILATIVLAGPASAQDAAARTTLNVVASFSILADLVQNVGGDRVAVTALVGPDGDAHVYNPSPSDAKTVAAARVVFVNGLGFEGWLDRLIAASGTKAPTVVATAGIAPRQRTAAESRNDPGKADPHAWQSVANARVYVGNIRDGLIAADPAGRPAYEANATAYLGRLDALDREVRAAVADIPPERRRVITTHDAFGYFRDAYGVEFIAPQGVSTESEASAKDVARIVAQIRQQKIPAVFLENVMDPRLVRQIARETGAKVGGTLYSDALTGPKDPAPTYIDMVRHNIRTLAAALMG